MSEHEMRPVAARPVRAGRPALLFVAFVLVTYVALLALGMSGAANPRLGGWHQEVQIDGTTYQMVEVRNDAPTAVTIEGARFAGTTDGRWPVLFDGVGDGHPPRSVRPVRSRALEPGETTTVYVRCDGSSSDRMEVRARTRLGVVRVVTLSGSPGSFICSPPHSPR